jgi:hypothetical protein
MNILFDDVLQYSDAPKKMITASLADYYNSAGKINILLQESSVINSVGIGNMNSDNIQIELVDTANNIFTENIVFQENGLYLLSKEYVDITQMNVTFTSTHIGRLAAGKAVNLRTSIPKEPTLVSTYKPRVTLSGQVIDGLGGYNYWRVSLDTRYKIDKEKMNEIIKGFPVLSRGFPVFISFEDEKERLPFNRLYANDTNQQELSFESSINKPLFSRKWVLEERF